MRARYYNQDIKRFINRDVVSGEITNSGSLNRYCYVQGNPVSLTDPFGLCPDSNSAFKNLCNNLYHMDWNALGHAALDVAGIFFDGADVINAIWYACEGNMEMAAASAVCAIPALGMATGNLLMKSNKLAAAGKAVKAIAKMTQGVMGVCAGIEMAKTGFTNFLDGLEAGTFDAGALLQTLGGIGIAMLSGKGMASSGQELMASIDNIGKTKKLENKRFYKSDGTPIYPPRGGFEGKIGREELQPGILVDRYGYEGGKYVSPLGTSYSERSLPKGTNEKPYHVYEVMKPVKVKSGKVAPWFGETGGGIQYQFRSPISKLIKKGILREVV